MTLMAQGTDVQFADPSVVSCPELERIIQPRGFEAQWQTPGLRIAQQIANHPAVRFVGEKMRADDTQVIVVADDDPEDLLTRLFAAEQQLYAEFKRLRFDCRLRVVSANEDISTIENSTIQRYERV